MNSGGFERLLSGVKTGMKQDPLAYVKRPEVVFRMCALLMSIIVFGSVSSRGWFFMKTEEKDVCMINTGSPSICTFPTYVGILGFFAAIGFMIGEWFFEQISAVQSRKRYLIVDMFFSLLWSLLYAIAFILMANSWRKADTMFAFAHSNIVGAIFFAFISVFCWLASVGFAYQRYQMGSVKIFSQGLVEEGNGEVGNHQEINGYCEPPSQVGGQEDLSDEDEKYHQKDFNPFNDFGQNLNKDSYGAI